jgi:HSP20 family protein
MTEGSGTGGEREREQAPVRDVTAQVFARLAAHWTADDDVALGAWSPAADVEETAGAYEVIAEVPGVSADDVAVDLDGDLLAISGTRRFPAGHRREDFPQVEGHYGRFLRAFRLPTPVDRLASTAVCADGLLTIHLPKGDPAGRGPVPVRADRHR